MRLLALLGILLVSGNAYALTTGAASYAVQGATVNVQNAASAPLFVSTHNVNPGPGSFWNTSGSTVAITNVNGSTITAVLTNSSVSVSNFPAVQAVSQSGSFTVTPGTGSWNVNGSTLAITNVAGSTITVVLTNSSVAVSNIPQVTFSSGSFSNPFYTLSTNTVISTGSITAFEGGAPWTVNVTTLPGISPGVRASTGVTVQELKDTGRQVIISSAAAVTGTTSEAIFTLTVSTAFLNGLSGTSFGVTPGKTLRLQNFSCTWKTTGATSVGGECHLHVVASGTCTATSPNVAILGFTIPSGGLAAGSTAADHISFYDGFEISGTDTFCITHQESSTASTVDVVLMGYQY